MLIMSLFFMFVTTAFVANVVVRDDETGFGPIVRSTRVTQVRLSDRPLPRRLRSPPRSCFLAVPLGIWLGSLMPWVDPETLGPEPARPTTLFAYFVLALPNILVTSAIFFALATVTRSMMATYVGVDRLPDPLSRWSNGTSGPGARMRDRSLAYLEPFGVGAVGEATRYWTAAERNSLLPPLEGALLWNRLIWIAIAGLFLALAHWSYRFADKGMSRRQRKKRRRWKRLPRPARRPTPSARCPRPASAARRPAPSWWRAPGSR